MPTFLVCLQSGPSGYSDRRGTTHLDANVASAYYCIGSLGPEDRESLFRESSDGFAVVRSAKEPVLLVDLPFDGHEHFPLQPVAERPFDRPDSQGGQGGQGSREPARRHHQLVLRDQLVTQADRCRLLAGNWAASQEDPGSLLDAHNPGQGG